MPLFTPGHRHLSTFTTLKSQHLGERALVRMERIVKGPLFGCRMCGNCLLQETAFICPMSCPKGLRNGPCGGSTSERCYVDERYPCAWHKIYERSFAMGREEMLLEVLPPLDWERVGTQTWNDVWQQVRKVGIKTFTRAMISGDVSKRTQTWDAVFRPVRQPGWWQGDSEYHRPTYDEPVSELERRLRAGEFVVATEIAPPTSTATTKLLQHIDLLKPLVTAINFTDNPMAKPRMSSLACSVIALQQGAEPVFQMTARDRTRTSLQSEVLGACALGVRNILCVSGDSNRMGPTPTARTDIVDIDSVQMLWILRRMRDEGQYLDQRLIETPPRFFLGAAASPFSSEPHFQALREQKKVNAGAQFFQTNAVFDADRLDLWLNALAKRNVLDKVFILVGIVPLKSLKMAQYMQKVPGVFLPDSILKRLEKAGAGSQEEGLQIALELIDTIKLKQGIQGIHIMAVNWESIVPRMIIESGLESQLTHEGERR